jgi:Ca-activated chloride channel family protein
MLETFHFLRPGWLMCIPVALLLGYVWARRARRPSRWQTRIDPALLGALLEHGRPGQARRLPWLLGAALALGAVGLAGPAWERTGQPVERQTDALVILLDLSLSMYAEDVQPSRIVRARQKIADVLRERREGITALVAYAGNAHTVVPLTDDVRTIANLLPALAPDMMPVFGSNVGDALDLAHELFRNGAVEQGLILVVTDGIDRIGDATERRNPAFPISILGIGTEIGGTIPLPVRATQRELLRTRQGEPVTARLDPARLGGIAGLTGGRYRTVTVDDADILDLLATPAAGAPATRLADRRFDLWIDQGFWIAVLLLPVMLLGFRRGVLTALPLLLIVQPVAASPWDDLWARRDQQAYRQLQEGQPEHAAALFDDPAWRAAALYRSGEHERAANAYGELAERSTDRRAFADLRYNQGNALAHNGDLEGALAQYHAALAANPAHVDADRNRALVQRALEEQAAAKPDQPEAGTPQAGSPDSSGDASPPGPDDPATADDAEAAPGAGRSPADRATDAAEGAREETPREQDSESMTAAADRDALEQSLRRIPDDPGGLLRRKFQYETAQRLRSGGLRAPDPEKVW